MPEGQSWLNRAWGYKGLEHFFEGFGPSWMFHHPVEVQHIAAILLVALLMTLLALVASRQLKAAGDDILPDEKLSARTFVELVMDILLKVMQFTMPYEAALRHFWIVGTLGFFVLFSNLIGVIPGFVPPTENYNTTVACGTIVFVYYNFYAFYKLGLGHLAHMANPVGEWWGWALAPLFLPVELISHCIRPISLATRLMCNIAGDHLVLGVFVGIAPFLVPIPFIGLGIFVALIQTVIFVLLSSVYIGEVEAMVAHHHAAHSHEHEPGAAHAHGAAEVAAH